ncbi:cyclin-T1 isoform X3 [Gallus gallus]|nr:cyclin-T1 isoform X3 [Gallus gallus]
MATNSLHLTTFSLQYTPPVVACVCIHLACKWSNWEIPVSTDGKHWWEYVDGTVTLELLDDTAASWAEGLLLLPWFPVQQLLWYNRDGKRHGEMSLNAVSGAGCQHCPSWSGSIPSVAPSIKLTHEFLQILEKTPNRLKRIRNWRASQAARKSKADEHGEDEGLSEQTILNMISRNNSSDMNIAGLMSMSTSSTAAAGPSVPTAADSPGNQSAADAAPAERWLSQHPPSKLDATQSHRTAEGTSGAEHPAQQQQQQQDGAGYPKQGVKNAPSAKVSLKEYRAKHAEELAAQKRQLENMEANVRSQYAYAAKNLLVQQQREREVQQDGNPSPIILKIPIAENPERPPGPEKGDKSSALKLRIPMGGGGGERPLPSKQEEIKMRIKVPSERPDDGGATASIAAKSREHKEKHKGHSSNHHHHNHHSHKHLHPQLGAGPSAALSKRPGDSKHAGQPGAVPHKSCGLFGSSRKRPPPEEGSAHEHQPKVSKGPKGPAPPFPYPHLPGGGHSSDAITSLPTLPSAPSKARGGGHGKSDKGPAGANGHNATQPSDYQDTVNMLHSLLSAQGMQPSQAPPFEFHAYGELLNPRQSARAANTDRPRPPPLPSEPPPPLPPLPK